MKQSLAIMAAIFLCLNSNLSAQKDTPLNYITTINPEGKDKINFLLDGEFEMEFWDKDYISIEIEIKDNQNKHHITKHLASEGRFELRKLNEEDALTIVMPNRRKKVKVNSMNYEDELTFRILLPHYTTLSNWENTDGLIASLTK
mgnify:CR=1 FL=1